ncbi:MAG: collagen binding domain-containing protein [Coprobacillaceae bacterium]
MQNLVWEYLGYSDYYVSDTYPTRESQQDWKNQVMNKVNSYTTKVSFHNTEHELTIGETISFNDDNGVLNTMDIISTDGLEVSIYNNELVVKATINASDSATIKLKKSITNEGTNFVVRNGNSQSVSVLKTKEVENNWITFKVNKYIDVNLKKVDADSGEYVPQGDATLIGAEYGLFNGNDELLVSRIFDEVGVVRFEKLWTHDTYYIKETKAPIGYVLSDEVIYVNPTQLLSDGVVELDLQWHVTTKENVIKQAFSLIKISTNGESGEVPKLEGAEFTVKLESEIEKVGWDEASIYDVLVTDENGSAISKELPYGTYIVKETKTPPDVITTRDFTVIINQDNRTPQVYRILNDAPFEAYLKLVKKDIKTGEVVILNEASFQIKDSTGKVISQKIGNTKVDTFKTDETGMVTTPLKLKAGTYFIEEIQTPLGYLTLENPIEVIIKNQGAVEIDGDEDPVITIAIENDKPTGSVIIKKSFEDLEQQIQGFAKFRVETNCDIINPSSGKVIYYKGEVIPNPDDSEGLYRTDENLTLEIRDLPLSLGEVEYKIIEVETLPMYQLHDEILVTFKQEDTVTNEYVYNLEIENELTEIEFRKEDSITKELVENAKLQILDMDGNLILEWTSKQDAELVKGLERGKEYILHEVEAPKGYLLANDVSFIVEKDPIVTMKDQPILTEIELTKIDSKTKEIIKNKDFSFGLYLDEECNKEIDIVKADIETGTITFRDIAYGVVYIKEIDAPQGYQLSKEVISIEINDELEGVGNIHKVTFENTLAPIIETGDSNEVLFYSGICMSILGSIIVFIFRKRSE